MPLFFLTLIPPKCIRNAVGDVGRNSGVPGSARAD